MTVGTYPPREIVELMFQELVPRIAELPGFRGGNVLIERETGDLLATVFWESLEDLEASREATANLAAGVQVLTDGELLEPPVCDVMVNFASPEVANRDLGAE